MKQSEFIKSVLSGKPAILVEYRSFAIDKITYRDKASGQQVSKDTVSHSVEAGDVQMRVTEWVPDGVAASALKPEFKKGDRCVFHIKSMNSDKGILRAQGELTSFEPDEVKK